MKEKPETYKKHNSFSGLHHTKGTDKKGVVKRLQKVKADKNRYAHIRQDWHWILDRALSDLVDKDPGHEGPKLELSAYVIGEIQSFRDDAILPRYLVHRYRYEIFPQTHTLDDYPPCVQLEPSSICNYRCVFCYQVDKSFSRKSSGHMGYMPLSMFKAAIDEIAGHVDILTFASRGEPTLSPDFNAMMAYTQGKFLNLKINTNASLLTEELCHAILQGGCKTLVISADAAKEPDYGRLRVNGKLDKVLANVERFRTILETQYATSEIITRVSGVHLSGEQSIDDMTECWGGLVDEVAFVHYNPSFGHLNAYEQDPNSETRPCSDLWRRMYVWVDGTGNPCDVDYKSHLKLGRFPSMSISQLWHSSSYNTLREDHLSGLRQSRTPCSGCVVV